MIAETLLPFAKLLDGSDLIGERCFLFERCEVDFDGLKKNIEHPTGTKINIPILLYGKEVKSTVNGFAGRGKANASKATFQKYNEKFKSLYNKQPNTVNPYPVEYFPHKNLEFKIYSSNDLLDALESIQNIPADKLCKLFSSELQPFTFTSVKDMKLAVKKCVCLPVTPNAPGVIIHALLVINAVNYYSSLLDIENPTELFTAETYRFILLFWFVDSLKGYQLEVGDKSYGLSFGTTIAGNIVGAEALLKSNMLISLKNDEYFGGKYISENPVLNFVQELTNDNNADTIKIAGQPYTAPKTGISPTSSFLDSEKEENTLTKLVRNGVDTAEMLSLLDNYTALIAGTRFSLGAGLGYYFFPETSDKTRFVKYINALKNHIIECDSLKDEQDREKNTAAYRNLSSSQKKEKHIRYRQLREQLWVRFLLNMDTDKFVFAFEEEVGSNAGKFYTWSNVYHGILNYKLFLMIYFLDNPLFYSLHNALKLTSHNLSESWTVNEKKRLIDSFMNGQQIVWTKEWMRWRKFFLLSSIKEIKISKKIYKVDASSWEGAFHFIMLLNQIQQTYFDASIDGNTLIRNFNTKLEIKMGNNKERIEEYLKDIFQSDNEKVLNDIQNKAKDYSRFIDTNVDKHKWHAVIDGLICGWALKGICRKLRPESDDYKKVIGGRSLSKMSPFEVNEKMIQLREKVNRQEQDAWNVDAPMEKLLLYVQKKPNSETVRLFSDALALGFMRFDKTN